MERLKETITDYWTQRAEGFQEQRIREFESEKHKRWMEEFHKYLPTQKPLRILDLGTGTGFFAFLLAEEGHTVTGIDLTPDMIKGAKQTANRLHLDASFYLMDAEHPDFPSESFDVLVSRNLTWTLPHLPKAYEEWYKLLAPGGCLINFDADYCSATYEDPDDLPANHAHKMVSTSLLEKNDEITLEMAAYQKPRPQWDVQLLIEAGFERISIDTGVYKRIYAEKDEFFNPIPIFTIVAYK